MVFENVLICALIAVFVYLVYDTYFIKEEHFTDFSSEYDQLRLKEPAIKKKKMEEIEAEAEGSPTIDKAPVPLPQVLLHTNEETPERPDLQYAEKLTKRDADQWKITPEDKGWLGSEVDGVPNLFPGTNELLN